MRTFKDMPFDTFLELVKSIPAIGQGEERVKAEIVGWIEGADDVEKECETPEYVLNNIADECHDGAFTIEENPEGYFEDDDVSSFYLKLRKEN